jgi:stress response protein YsnF
LAASHTYDPQSRRSELRDERLNIHAEAFVRRNVVVDDDNLKVPVGLLGKAR